MSTPLIESEQAETTRLMVMIERLQQSGAAERDIAAAVREATGGSPNGGALRAWRARLRAHTSRA